MSNFATLVRRTMARENDMAGSDYVGPGQVDEVLADPISADIQSEVVADAASADVGTAEMDIAASTADELSDTAATLEATTENGGEGVDEAAAQLAVASLERCQRYYGIQRSVTFSKESFSTKRGRRELTLQLAREAEEASKSLWARVVETAEKLWQWLKNFVAGLFDKRKRLATRAEALITKAGELEKAGAKPADDAKIDYSGPATVLDGKQTDKPVQPILALSSVIESLGLAKTLIESSTAQASAATPFGPGNKGIEINKKGVGNVFMFLQNEGERVSFVKEQGKATVEKQEIAPLTFVEVKEVATAAKTTLTNLSKAEQEVKAAEKAVGGLIGKLKSLVTGKEHGHDEKTDRGVILSKLNATSSLVGNSVALALTVIDSSLTAGARSLATYKAPEKKK